MIQSVVKYDDIMIQSLKKSDAIMILYQAKYIIIVPRPASSCGWLVRFTHKVARHSNGLSLFTLFTALVTAMEYKNISTLTNSFPF